MKPIPSKTNTEYPFLILAKGERKEKTSNIFSLETFITPFNFHQIQLPRAVLNAELKGLFETVIGIKIWPSIDREITLNIECRIAVPRL